jgi:hypothetical protein
MCSTEMYRNFKNKRIGIPSLIATGLQAGRPGFDSRQVQEFLLHSVQTDSGARPTTSPLGTGGGVCPRG